MEGMKQMMGTIVTAVGLLTGGMVGYGQLKAEVNNVKEDVVELSENNHDVSIHSVKIENIENDIAECKDTLYDINTQQNSLSQEIQRISTTLNLIHSDIRNGRHE